MTKLEVYDYLCENSNRLFNRKGGVLNIKKLDIFNEIEYDFIGPEDLYNFLNPEISKECRLHSCDNRKKFRSFTTGYKDFCSIRCNNIWLSESRTGAGNPIHRMTDENRLKMKATLSRQVKERIKKGTWTPCITNSWCHSRYRIQFKRNNKILDQNVRSSWEAFYQLLNPNFEYEKLRVPYYYNNEWHSYIVDFIDNNKKIVIEIKPKKEMALSKNVIKENVLIQWCKDNNYKYEHINEDYFKNIIWDFKILENQPDKERLLKFKKYFSNEN